MCNIMLDWSSREPSLTLAIIFGLKKFFYYLIGRKFVIKCDNESLKYSLNEFSHLGWNDVLSRFKNEIQHIKGKDNEENSLVCLEIMFLPYLVITHFKSEVAKSTNHCNFKIVAKSQKCKFFNSLFYHQPRRRRSQRGAK